LSDYFNSELVKLTRVSSGFLYFFVELLFFAKSFIWNFFFIPVSYRTLWVRQVSPSWLGFSSLALFFFNFLFIFIFNIRLLVLKLYDFFLHFFLHVPISCYKLCFNTFNRLVSYYQYPNIIIIIIIIIC
jgi:hypothetical protein